MKKTHSILLIGLLSFYLNLSGQELRILNTKDLVSISNEFGLDSALHLTLSLPIYYLDTSTANELFNHVVKIEPSERVERFLIDYSLKVNSSNIPEILFNYYKKKYNLINSYQPDYFGGLPEISNNTLLAIIANPFDQTDSLLIEYYKAWAEKSELYKTDYLKGIKESNSREKEKLMTPFQDCHLNCYKLLLALDSLKSNFPDSSKFKYHNEYLKSYNQNMFLYKSGSNTNYNVDNKYKKIKLKNQYENIGEIDFNDEPELKALMDRYNKSYCWKFLMYNDKVGYLDLGCQSGPLAGDGIVLRLILKDNRLEMHLIKFWIS